MSPEENKIDSKEELADALHKKSALPALKSYQGDIAQFIQEKNKSFIDISLQEKEKKEKERGEERKKEEKEKNPDEQEKQKGEAVKTPGPKIKFWSVKLPTGILSLVLSVFLVIGASAIAFYTFYLHKSSQPVTNLNEMSIVRVDQQTVADIASLNTTAFKDVIAAAKETAQDGAVLEIKITSQIIKKGVSVQTFLSNLNFKMPASLNRSLQDEFMAGIYGEKEGGSFFLILKENDYGIAFRDMLEWEPGLFQEMRSIMPETSLATTSNPVFKDFIFSNKDTRVVFDDTGQVSLIYAFLDKNTILIAESETALKAVVDSYLVKNFVR